MLVRRVLLYSLCGLPSLWPLLGAAQAADSLAPAAPAWRWVSSRTTAAGECQEVFYCDSSRGVVRVYYSSGRLQSYMPFVVGLTVKNHGVATTWYESGELQARQEFSQGLCQSLVVYYPGGAIKRRSTYAGGRELVGSCYGPDGQPVAYTPYEQPPLYPGGDGQLQKDLVRHLRVPASQRQLLSLLPGEQQIEVVFEVAEDGSTRAPRVLAPLAELVEPLRQAILQLPRRFRPGQRDGAITTTYYRVLIPVRAIAFVRALPRARQSI